MIGYDNMTLASSGFEGVVIVGCDRNSLLGDAWTRDAARTFARDDGAQSRRNQTFRLPRLRADRD